MIDIKKKPKSEKPNIKNIYIGQRPKRKPNDIIDVVVNDIKQGGAIRQAIKRYL